MELDTQKRAQKIKLTYQKCLLNLQKIYYSRNQKVTKLVLKDPKGLYLTQIVQLKIQAQNLKENAANNIIKRVIHNECERNGGDTDFRIIY